MKVRMLTSIAGAHFSYIPGEIGEVDDADAARLIARGFAEVIEITTKAPVKERTVKKRTLVRRKDLT